MPITGWALPPTLPLPKPDPPPPGIAWRRRARIIDPVQKVRPGVPHTVDGPADRPKPHRTRGGRAQQVHRLAWASPSQAGRGPSRMTGIRPCTCAMAAFAAVTVMATGSRWIG